MKTRQPITPKAASLTLFQSLTPGQKKMCTLLRTTDVSLTPAAFKSETDITPTRKRTRDLETDDDADTDPQASGSSLYPVSKKIKRSVKTLVKGFLDSDASSPLRSVDSPIETTPVKSAIQTRFSSPSTPKVSTPLRRSSLPMASDSDISPIKKRAVMSRLGSIEEEEKENTDHRQTRLMTRSIIDTKKTLGTQEYDRAVEVQLIRKEQEAYMNEDSSESDSSASDEESCGLNASKAYFKQSRDKVVETSNNTLKSVTALNNANIIDILRSVPEKHSEETRMIIERYIQQFEEWSVELSNKFNLLLIGFGSKIKLMEAFKTSYCDDAPCVTLNGFHPSATVQHLLESIIDNAIVPKKTISAQDRLAFINAYYNTPTSPKIYIFIHNIEGVTLRLSKHQQILAELASMSGVMMIASMDHINATLMWNFTQKQDFRWLTHDTTTFSSYITELTFESTHLFNPSATNNHLDIRGALYILKSLPLNTKKILKLLADYQIETLEALGRCHPRSGKKEDPVVGLTHKDLYARCISRFITQNDTLFRTQLVELKDHKLVASVGNGRGDAVLYIPLDVDALTGVLEGAGI